MSRVRVRGLLLVLLVGSGCGGSATNASGDGDGDGDGDDSSEGGSGGTANNGTGAMSSGAAASTGATTGDGGTSTGGGGGTGGAPPTGGTGGTGTGGEATGGTGTGGGPTGVVEVPESMCGTPGALACAGNNQQVALVCSGGIWQVSQVCPASQACDSTPGTTQGTCKDRHPDCIGQDPGEPTSCSGDTTLMVCGADNISLEGLECTGSCFNDACDNRPNYCPNYHDIFINCGTDCGEFNEDYCSAFGQCANAAIPGEIFDIGETLVVRSPGYASACSTTCDQPRRRVSVAIPSLPSPRRFKVTVSSPWKVSSTSSTCPGT